MKQFIHHSVVSAAIASVIVGVSAFSAKAQSSTSINVRFSAVAHDTCDVSSATSVATISETSVCELNQKILSATDDSAANQLAQQDENFSETSHSSNVAANTGDISLITITLR